MKQDGCCVDDVRFTVNRSPAVTHVAVDATLTEAVAAVFIEGIFAGIFAVGDKPRRSRCGSGRERRRVRKRGTPQAAIGHEG